MIEKFTENLNLHRTKIVSDLIQFIQITYPTRTTEPVKCSRDINYIIDSIVYALKNNMNLHLVENIADRFWYQDKLLLKNNEVELATYEKLEMELKSLSDDNLIKEFIVTSFEKIKDILINGRDKNITTTEEVSWKRIVKARQSWPLFKSDPIDRNIIEEIIDELYHFMPSKQNKFPFYIKIFDWSNADVRQHIFKECHRNENHSVDEDLGNPQVLAPWLIAFSYRSPELRTEVEKQEYKDLNAIVKQGQLEIGIASTFIAYACEARNIQTGFCGCIRNPDQLAKKIGMPSGHVSLFMGIGVADKSATEYTDPRTNTVKKLSSSNLHHKINAVKKSEFILWDNDC
jgi:nitroreductase